MPFADDLGKGQNLCMGEYAAIYLLTNYEKTSIIVISIYVWQNNSVMPVFSGSDNK